MKELDLTEGRSTGIPTIQSELKKNGSPRATIETNEERTFINVSIPVHSGCGDIIILNDPKDGTQDVPQGVPQGIGFDQWIEEQIRQNPKITTAELAEMSGRTAKTIKRHLTKMEHIKFVGSGYSGHWVQDKIMSVNGMPKQIRHPIADMFESLKLEWGLTCGAGIIL